MEQANFGGQRPLSESFTVYILKCGNDSFYVGCTISLKDRLYRHKHGQIKTTKSRLPVQLVTYLVFDDRYRAYQFEKYLKTGSGRAFMNKRLI